MCLPEVSDKKGYRMKEVPFVKYTLHGNKFVIVDETLNPILTETEKSHFAYQATDIYYGVGSDNFLVIQPCNSEVLQEINETRHYWNELPDPATSDCIFRMFEPDGTEAFSCGNGLLCISNYLYQKCGMQSVRMMTEIPGSEPKVITIGTYPEKEISWANMGRPRKVPSKMISPSVAVPYDEEIQLIKNIRINFPHDELNGFKKGLSLSISGYLIFTGEPHLVVFTESGGFSSNEMSKRIFNSSCPGTIKGYREIKTNPGSRLIHQIGISLNEDYRAEFPVGINLNLIRVRKDSGVIEYRCFERGINRETWACGTGAVAASFVATRLNLLKKNCITLWPHQSRLFHPDVQLWVRKKKDDYILYGTPLLLFGGTFFL
jgi:diaminopimelate epimerase